MIAKSRFTDTSNNHTVELPKVVVTSSARQKQMSTAQSLSIIDVSSFVGTSNSLADIIAQEPGVQTRRYGGTGSFQTVSIRGVQGSKVLVLLDGIPLNSAMGGAVDLGKLNPARFRQVEVYKGIIPAQFGGNSIGGIVNLKSRTNSAGNLIDVYGRLGSYGNQSYSAYGSQSVNGKVDLFEAVSFIHSDNDFKYLDNNSTPYNSSDDTVKTLQNGQFTSGEIRAHPSVVLFKDHRLSAGIAGSFTDQHIPAQNGATNRTALFSEKKGECTISLHNENDSMDYSLTPTVSYAFTDGKTSWTPKDKGFISFYSTQSGQIDVKDQVVSINLLTTTVSHVLKTTTIVNGRYEDVNPVSDVNGAFVSDWHSNEATIGAAGDIVLPIAEIVNVTLGTSIKGLYSKTTGGSHPLLDTLIPALDTLVWVTSFSGGLSYKPMNTFMVYANFGRYSNPPSLRDRYGGKGALLPNFKLVPEIGNLSELGFKLQLPWMYSELVGFYNRLENNIVILASGYQSKPINSDGAECYGIEFNVHSDISTLLSCDANATVQHTENLAREYNWNGRRLPDEPDFNLFAGIEIRPLPKISCFYGVHYKSFYFHGPGNTPGMRVPIDTNQLGQIYQNMKISFKPCRTIECGITGNNLINSLFTNSGLTNSQGNFSWVLEPDNEWSLYAKVSF